MKMNNIIMMIICALVFFTQNMSSAISPVAINEPQMVNENVANQVKKTGGPAGVLYHEKFDMLTKRYNENLRNCVPLHFNQYIDIFGLKIYFNFDINGWVNNKCEIKISGNIKSVGKDIREVYEIKVSDEQLAQINPVVECNFTKDQLAIAVDALVSRNKQSEIALKKMMSAPEKAISLKKQYTPEEEKFFKTMMSENVCQLQNKDELMRKIEKIITPESL